MTVIEDAANLIRTRLVDLAAEQDKLERALGELDGPSVRPSISGRRHPGRPKGSGKRGGPKTRGSGRKQGPTQAAQGGPVAPKVARKQRRQSKGKQIPRAEREQAILAFLKKHPSASAKEIGTGVGTSANYINNILTGLRKQGRLVRKADGTQVEVSAVASSSAAANSVAAKSETRKKVSGKKRASGIPRSGKRRAKKSAGKAAAKTAKGK